jgi:hypothetical protein
MQEFSSVTASSYDADSLAPLLNEKAADGWSVVSIVAAGTNIVAYLQREADDTAASVESADVADDTAAAADVPTYGDTEAPAEVAAVEEAADESTIGSPFIPAAAAAAVAETAPAAVDEPAGWANAPEQAIETPVLADTADTSVADLAAQVSTPEPVIPVATPEPVVAAPEPEPVVVPEPEPVVAAAAESAVPAGWYADPSGRFELRYWDGAAWTEHVSRAGQQFTDPPVA